MSKNRMKMQTAMVLAAPQHRSIKAAFSSIQGVGMAADDEFMHAELALHSNSTFKASAVQPIATSKELQSEQPQTQL